MADEPSNLEAAANISDAAVLKDAAPVKAGETNAPEVSQAANVLSGVEEHYRGIKPFDKLGLKLFLVMVGVAALFTIAAAIRQKYFEWPPFPHLVVTPKKNLPAYHQIQPSELSVQARLTDKEEAETPWNAEDVVGRFTLEALPEGKPIAKSQLGPAVNGALFSGKAVVEVTVTRATILDGKIKSGDVVDLIFETLPTQGQQQPQPLSNSSFQNIFVLNVKPIGKPDPAAPGQPENNYLLILALPSERYAEFVVEIAKKTSLIVRAKELTN
jgi:hypothetical protein